MERNVVGRKNTKGEVRSFDFLLPSFMKEVRTILSKSKFLIVADLAVKVRNDAWHGKVTLLPSFYGKG